MNDRERLIELLSENFVEYSNVQLIAGNCKISAITLDADKMADHLIANGVVVQKQGKWIAVPSSDMVTGKAYECSECKKMRFGSFKPNYCPNCGADMRERKEKDV